MRAWLPDHPVRTPASLAEALDLMAAEPGRWRPLAGGTDLMVALAAGRLAPGGFLDLSRLEALRGIREEPGCLVFGALSTYREVRAHPLARRSLPALVRSAAATGAPAIQNRGTLGGNLVNASPAADTPPSLLAYGAAVVLASARGRRELPLAAFHQGYKRLDLAPDELLTEIRVPLPEGTTFHYFRKVGTRAAQAVAKVSLAAFARIEAGRLAEVRVALGAVAPVPLRALGVERVLAGRVLADLDPAEARRALQEDIAPIDDVRSNARYRRAVAGNLLEEAMLGMAGPEISPPK